MKLITQSILAIVTLSTASLTFAADPLANTKWQTIDDETGKAAATIKFTESGGVLTGKMISGHTSKAKKYVGTTIVTNLKSQGKGKYGGGKIFDPSKGKKYKLTATLKGNTLKLKGHLGPFYRSQVWKKK